MTRGETGRGSAGARARQLDRDEVLQRRAIVKRLPRSPERAAALRTIRRQLTSIDRRVATNG